MSPTFRSLGVRNYRVYASGQLVANIGVWMQRVAQDWLVLTLSHGSGVALGVTVGLQFLPILLFSLWGGTLADRFPRRTMLLVTATAMGALALVMGVVVLSGLATVALVMALAFLLGAVAAVDAPARQAMVSELVGREDLPNAVALNSASFNLGRVLGPATAGLLVAAVGTGWVFVLNAAAYVAVVAALVGLDPRTMAAPDRRDTDRPALREGLRYVAARPGMLMVLVIAFFVGTFGLNYQLTIALMTTQVFGMGSFAFGVGSTVLALGSLSGSLLAARRGAPRLRLVVLAASAFGGAAVLVSVMPTYLAFVAVLPLVGVAALTLMNAMQSYLQMHAAPEVRGRVMGVYLLVFMGGTPLGSPLVGWIGETFGPRWSIALGGAVSIAAAVVAGQVLKRHRRLAVRPHLRPRPHFHVDRAPAG